MNEEFVSKARLVAYVLWGLVVVELCTAWVLMVAEPSLRQYGAAMAATCSTTAVIAAVAQVRSYIVQVSSLIRLAHGLGLDREHGLQSVR